MTRSRAGRIPAISRISAEPDETIDDSARSSRYQALKGCLTSQQLFARPDHSRMTRLLVWLPIFVLSFGLLHVLPTGWPWIVCLLLASVGLLQMGYVGHECGHLAISSSRRVNDWIGQLAMTTFCGMSFGHWRHQHNRHHAHCQEIGRDPDTHYGILFSVYPGSASWHSRLGRFFLAIQPYAFWPLTTLYWVTLRYDAVRDLVQKPEETRPDRLFLPLHFLLLLIAPMLLVGWRIALLDYVAVSCISSVLTAAVFAPNHIGMPMLAVGDHLEFVEQQVTMSRNLSSPAWLDFLFGGLNAQIEHHLFPRLSAARLRLARPIVKSYCDRNQIAYREESLPSAMVSVVRHLNRIRLLSRREAALAHDPPAPLQG